MYAAMTPQSIAIINEKELSQSSWLLNSVVASVVERRTKYVISYSMLFLNRVYTDFLHMQAQLCGKKIVLKYPKMKFSMRIEKRHLQYA